MKFLFTLLICALGLTVTSQEQLFLNGAIGIKMEGPDDVFVVLDRATPDAISGTSTGTIYSQAENHVLRWNMGATATPGPYVVPFLSLTGGAPEYVYVLLSNVVGGVPSGAGMGHVDFSTYATPGNNLPWPSGVTHMTGPTSGVDNSANVIDRFWVIDAQGYATRPGVDMTVRYDEDELDAGMVETQMILQRFNSDVASPTYEYWSDFNTAGSMATINAGANTISWSIPSGEFHKAWTLSKSGDPLPIELLYMNATCAANGRVLLNWATASESNNKEFVLERSEDGIIWEAFEVTAGVGNSSAEVRYEAYDDNPFDGITYYRMTQVDFDGTTETFDPVVSDCDGVGFELISVYAEERGEIVNLVLSAGTDESFDIEILDMSGKLVTAKPNVMMKSGMNFIQLDKRSVGFGMYVVKLQSENNLLTRKILLN